MKECELIATIPSIVNIDAVNNVFDCPYISDVRWNSGIATPYSEIETLKLLLKKANVFNKKLWVDIKGRQLRVTKWADPLYDCIELNHKVSMNTDGFLVLRGEEKLEIKNIENGNKIYVSPLPRNAVGAGQSVNILSSSLKIEGYLTEKDIRYLEACKELGIKNIMASFVESIADIIEIIRIIPDANIIVKIESKKGMNFLLENYAMNLNVMAARDDLFIELENVYETLKAIRAIINTDKNAICASRIFSSLMKSSKISHADYLDIETMYSYGYKRFMLCDDICNNSFNAAIKGWRNFING